MSRGGKILDITGLRFGRLQAIRLAEREPKKPVRWVCKCNCGKEITTSSNTLRVGNTKSCGCLKLEMIAERGRSAATHGCSRSSGRTAEYWTWSRIIQRTTNPKYPDYQNYCGRGIGVCDRWRSSFQNFLEDMGERPTGLTIERRDNSLGYTPENCLWATRTQQQRNRRNTLRVTYMGETRPLKEWSEIVGIGYHILWKRINDLGMNVDRAMTQPGRRTK